MNNFSAAAKVLDELMLELTGMGLTIPVSVADDLKAARSLTNISQRQPADSDSEYDIGMKTMTILQNAEMNLLSLAETGVGADYADTWQKALNDAYQNKVTKAAPGYKPTFIPGIPKGEHWVRLQTDELADVSELDAMLGEYALTSAGQPDGWLLVHGKKEDVSSFLKALRQIIGKNGV